MKLWCNQDCPKISRVFQLKNPLPPGNFALHEREGIVLQISLYEPANCPQAVAVFIDKGSMTALTATETRQLLVHILQQ